MQKKTVLCTYITRQIDSNLFMSSTVFNGLQQAGYDVDIFFIGYREVVDVFKQKYGHYFNNVYEIEINKGWLTKYCKSERRKVLYSYYRNFLMDAFNRPYSLSKVNKIIAKQYDTVLSFVPPVISGLLMADLKKLNVLKKAHFIQFWTDPLSLGRCDGVEDVPKSRFLHKWLEGRILEVCDKAVFSYPLLAETEKQLHPTDANKITWSDISYVEHPLDKGKPNNAKVRIGNFGAYQRRVRNVEPFLGALKYFPNVQFVMRGDADFEIEKSLYPNLDIEYGRRPANEIEQMEAECDILISIAGFSGVTHPSGKTFYYASYNKPIVHIGDGKNNGFLMKYIEGFEGRWIVCNNNVESIVEAFCKAIETLPTFELKIPKRMEPVNIARKLIED